MKIQGVIFDLDGTLINSVSLFVSAYKHALKECLQREFSIEEIAKHLGPNEKGVFKSIAPGDWASCLIEFYKYEKDNIGSVSMFDGIIDVLELLKLKNLRVGIVTGRAEVHAHLFIRKFGLDAYVEDIAVGLEESISKHSSIQNIVEKWTLDKRSVLYVGDTDTDILAANRAGVVPIFANWSSVKLIQEHGQRITTAFDTVKDFQNWLEGQIE